MTKTECNCGFIRGSAAIGSRPCPIHCPSSENTGQGFELLTNEIKKLRSVLSAVLVYFDDDISPDPSQHTIRDLVAEALGKSPTSQLIAIAPFMLTALKRAAPWLGKMIADGAHLNSIMPNDCVRTLEMVEAAIAKAEGSK